jgi:replication factor A1
MATATATQLTAHGLDKAKADSGFTDPLILRVSEVNRVNEAKWTATFSDGSGNRLSGVLTTQAIQRLSAKVANGSEALADGDVVRVSSYSCISHANQMRLMAMAVEVLQRASGGGGASAANANAPAAAAGGVPASPADGGPGGKDQANNPVTPARPPSSGAEGGAAPTANAPATVAPPPAPTPGEQPRLTPGSLAAAGLAPNAAAPSPGPPPPTAIAPGRGGAVTAANTTNSSSIPVRAANRPEPAGVVPIASLNPYESGCTIKAKVVRKNPMRSFNGRGGASSSVFSCELADAQGGAIQATFWREAAEKTHASLQEGRVYYFSRFSVKPSNKAYSAVRNDYELSFDPRGCEVEEAADQEASAEAVAAALKASVDAVPLARLPGHVGRKAPVDVLAFVLQVGPMGSVKRKADNAELARRDLVIGDATGRSVVLTVWNALASAPALDEAAAKAGGGGGNGNGGRPMVLQVTNVRVGDYNGCSLSTVMRSELTAEPQGPEADALREWWDVAVGGGSGGGAAPSFAPLGAAAAGAGGADGAANGGSRRNKITSIADMLVPRGQEPAPDAKPTYCTVLVRVDVFFLFAVEVAFFFSSRRRRKATPLTRKPQPPHNPKTKQQQGHIAHINADKDLYYLANAENGRKVVRQPDGKLWCEGDGKFVDACEHRYIFLARVEDESGEAYLNVFNSDGGRLLGGKTADELAAMREGGGEGGEGGGGEDALRRVLKSAQWTPWVFTVQCKSREYNGERRMRYSVMSAAPVDYREQAARMLAALSEM